MLSHPKFGYGRSELVEEVFDITMTADLKNNGSRSRELVAVICRSQEPSKRTAMNLQRELGKTKS